MTDVWSLDARALVRPARTFQTLAASETPGQIRATFWTVARRPVLLSLVLGCVISLIATSVATKRLIGATALYWSFVPIVEILALAAVVWRRRGARTLLSLIDAFFAGHAAWTLLLLITGAVLSVAPPQYWWFIISRLALPGALLVAAWSAYVDVCFFRYMCDASFAGATASAALYRVIAWMLIFWIFAVPDPTPLGVIKKLVEAVTELRQ